MENVSVIGLDLAKNIFQVHGANVRGKKVLSKKLRRNEVISYFSELQPCLIGMEACGGAHEWARRLQALGHTVKMMAPQYVKPYVQGNKTDARDAAGICEAAGRDSVPSIAIRSRDSQQMEALHRVREGWVKQRTATSNQIRGLLAEFGKVIKPGMSHLTKECRLWQAEEGQELGILNTLIDKLLAHLADLEKDIAEVDRQILQAHQNSASCKLIESIPGVGVMTATAVVSRFGNGEAFSGSRKFASAIGLTPKEKSSGGKQVLLGISKRGNSYIRKLLVHGARSVLCARMKKAEYADDWVVRLAHRRGYNIAVCALAAKNARRIWAMLRTGELFRTDYAQAKTACA